MVVNGCEWFIDDAGDPLKQTNSAEVLSGSLGPLERLVFIDKRPQCVEHLAKEAWMQRLAKSKMLHLAMFFRCCWGNLQEGMGFPMKIMK
jgi:hypothetical protein